jgi:hypothetical protein
MVLLHPLPQPAKKLPHLHELFSKCSNQGDRLANVVKANGKAKEESSASNLCTGLWSSVVGFQFPLS